MKKNCFLTFLCALLLTVGQAYALDIVPNDALLNGTSFTPYVENSQSAIAAALDARFEPDLVELYKEDFSPNIESGFLAGSYNTTFNNTATDPSGATIEYTGGAIITNAYLLVKDGNTNPWWYLFDLTESGLNWDGMETLSLSGFWPNTGAISHVTLYGGAAPVPEPGTIVLMGLGLVGLAGIGRKKIKS